MYCIYGKNGERIFLIDRGALTTEQYRAKILEEHVMSFAGSVGNDFLLMQNNARPHPARMIIQYPEEVDFPKMDCPTQSPDLIPIEHIWD